MWVNCPSLAQKKSSVRALSGLCEAKRDMVLRLYEARSVMVSPVVRLCEEIEVTWCLLVILC